MKMELTFLTASSERERQTAAMTKVSPAVKSFSAVVVAVSSDFLGGIVDVWWWKIWVEG